MKGLQRFWCGLVVCGVCAGVVIADEPATSEPASNALPEAADLVREVRAGEQWIHQIKSLQITYDEVEKRSEVGIAAALHARRKSGRSTDPNIAYELRPVTKSSIKVFFDGKRFRQSSRAEEELFGNDQLWDGTAAYDYRRWKETAVSAPYVSIAPKAFFDYGLSWLRGDVHIFDWTNTNRVARLYRPEEFVTVGRVKYRGVDCWKLMATNNDGAWPTRWFVGVADNRLYGVWEGAATIPAEQVAMAREFAAADGYDVNTEEDARTWFKNLSSERQKEVQQKTLDWVGRRGTPAQEFWSAEYVELKPGIWFPKRQGSQGYSDEKEDGTFGGPLHLDHIDEMTATDVRLDEEIRDGTFSVASLQIHEGTEVWDSVHSPSLEYRWKAKFTPEEWQAILDAAEKREAAAAQAVAAQQRAQAAKAAQRAMQNQRGPGGGP